MIRKTFFTVLLLLCLALSQPPAFAQEAGPAAGAAPVPEPAPTAETAPGPETAPSLEPAPAIEVTPIQEAAPAAEAPKPVPPAKPVAKGQVTLDFKDIELTELVKTISELTGRNFLYDDTVKGRATIISPRAMTLDEAYRLFLAVLNFKGYTVVPSGTVNKIVQIKDAKEANLPTVTGPRGEAIGEQFVTRLIPLQYLESEVMAATVLAPLVPKTSSIVAYPPSNTLIITDSAANIDRLLEIIRELDQPTALEQLEVIPLQFATAEEAAQLCNQVITQKAAAAPARRRVAANVQTAEAQKDQLKIIPYQRNNSLVVMASAEDMALVKNLVSLLDQRPPHERSKFNVYYLENADAETLAKTLNEILTGRAQSQAVPGRPAGQPGLTTEAVTITADKPTNSLIINANPEDYQTLRGIIGQLDIKRKQVYVEALILELSMDATRRLGVSLQGAVDVGNDSLVFGTSNLNTGPASLTDLAPVSGSNTPALLGRTIEGILLGGLFNPVTIIGPNGDEISVPALSALIDISKKDADVNILSAPRLLTSDNEEAEIIVGSNVPIITQRLTDTGASTGLAQSVAVERKDVALILRFTPQVTEGDLVRLNVYQEITDIAATSVGDVNEVGPTLTKRLLRNTVLVENGRTVVLGGLIGSNIQNTVSKVPLLGDIPFLGWLFKSTGKTERKTNLLVFITPKIIKDGNDLATVTRKSRNTLEQFQTEELRRSVPADAFSIDIDNRAPAAGGAPQQDR